MQALLTILQLVSRRNEWKNKTHRLTIITRSNFTMLTIFLFLNRVLFQWAVMWWAKPLGLHFPLRRGWNFPPKMNFSNVQGPDPIAGDAEDCTGCTAFDMKNSGRSFSLCQRYFEGSVVIRGSWDLCSKCLKCYAWRQIVGPAKPRLL